MTTHHVVFIIDQLNAFARADLTVAQGGSLYVPGGEKLDTPFAELVQNAHNTTFIFAQDFHDANHISFITSHPGVMAYRQAKLAALGHPTDEAAIFNPTLLPFSHLSLYTETLYPFSDQRTAINGFVIGDKIYDIQTKDDGSRFGPYTINKVTADCIGSSKRFTQPFYQQTLWPPHSIKHTLSSLPTPHLYAALPTSLQHEMQYSSEQLLHEVDKKNNAYFVIRKGSKCTLDSYGIVTENDGMRTTIAKALFAELAADWAKLGITKIIASIGGLATNFCVEFSHADLVKYLVPACAAQGIACELQLITDGVAGIPLSTPDGSWPDLAAAPTRMQQSGTTLTDFAKVAASLTTHNQQPLSARAAWPTTTPIAAQLG